LNILLADQISFDFLEEKKPFAMSEETQSFEGV
jgi:hypothetical protein